MTARYVVMSVAEARASGGIPWSSLPTLHVAWREAWDSINGKRAPWSNNPWVWALTFRRVTP